MANHTNFHSETHSTPFNWDEFENSIRSEAPLQGWNPEDEEYGDTDEEYADGEDADDLYADGDILEEDPEDE